MTGPRVAVITTSPRALRVFFLTQLRCIAAHGFDVHGIASPGKDLVEFSRRSRLPTYGVSMRREPSIVADFRSLLRLFNLVRRLKPQIVQTHTPKAGLLGMLAAFLAGVPVRIYTVNGLVLQSRSGWQRKLLSMTEWLGCAFSTQVLCVSHSLRRDVVAQGLCPAGKIKVLGHGGSHGVDLAKFSAGTFCERERSRTLYRIPAEALVMAFVGRFTRDKGLKELAASWSELRGDFPSLRLILCGQPEVHDAVPAPTMSQLVNDPRVHFIDAAPEDMPAVYSAVDLVVLPSYREGLPNVALECGAMKIPIVATRVAGCFDAIQDGITGLLVEPRNAEALTCGLRRLLQDPKLRQSMGEAAAGFVASHFDEKNLSQLLLEEYRRLLKEAVSPRRPVRSRRGAFSNERVSWNKRLLRRS